MAKRTKSKRPPSSGAVTSGRRRWFVGVSRRRIAASLFLGLTVLFFCNFRLRASGDSLPTRVLPFSILREGNLDLNEFTWAENPGREWPYYIHGVGRQPDRSYYSVSPIGTALVVTPFYVLPAAWLAWNDIDYVDSRARVVIVLMEKLVAAVVAATSSALLFLFLSRFVPVDGALGLTLIYALCTSTWSIASQALWPHAVSQLCLVGLFMAMAREEWSWRTVVAAGAICATMVATRPQMAIFAGVAGVFFVMRERRALVPFALLSLTFGGALVGYNIWAFGGAFGGYGGLGHFSMPLRQGVLGLLVSPNRGLFVYTPLAIFSFWGAVQVWRVGAPLWVRMLTVGLLLHIGLYAKFDEWHAGFSYGPRYFTDVQPLLVLLLVWGLVPLLRYAGARWVASTLVAFGFLVQVVGVYFEDDDWNRHPVSIDAQPERVWDWHDLQIARAATSGFKGFDLLPIFIDVFRDPVAARLEALDVSDLASRIELRGVPKSMRRGSSVKIRVELTNLGTAAWPIFSGKGLLDIRHLMFVVQSWSYGGAPLPGVGEVVPLPENLSPGETVGFDMVLAAPQQPGTFAVTVRVSQAIDGTRGTVSPDAATVNIRVD